MKSSSSDEGILVRGESGRGRRLSLLQHDLAGLTRVPTSCIILTLGARHTLSSSDLPGHSDSPIFSLILRMKS